MGLARRNILLACLALAPLGGASAWSLTLPQTQMTVDEQSTGLMTGLAQRPNLLGDLLGARTFLGRYGVTVGLSEVSEVLGNATGGIRRGAAYDGLTVMGLGLDTERAFHVHGGSLNVSALQIHGRNVSADNLGTLQTSSGIEADRSTRLWELWYQQKVLGDRMDIKLGLQSLDQEFIVSQNAGLFVNTMFGWPLLTSYDLPGGGPAYPLSALGVRVRATLIPGITLLAGTFNGSPTARFNTGDPQRRNASGTGFPLNGGTLVFGEVQYGFPATNGVVRAGESEVPAGTYKLGFWYNSESFADQRFDNTGVSLADPASNGTPRLRRNNFSVYGVMDQVVWHGGGDEVGRAVSVFARVMGAPGDRNLISFSLNAGVTLHDPWPGRDDDTVGIGMGYGRIGANARGLDQDAATIGGRPAFRRSSETFVELTYQAQIVPWMQLQPDIQYVFNPGAGIANPTDTTRKLRNEAIFGLRTTIIF